MKPVHKKPMSIDAEHKALFRQFPNEIAESFTDTQRYHIEKVFKNHYSKKHRIDIRFSVPLPFTPLKYYCVMLMGRDVRGITRQEKTIAALTLLLVVTLMLSVAGTLGIIILYLIKSSLGINLFDDLSLGLWEWLKGS